MRQRRSGVGARHPGDAARPGQPDLNGVRPLAEHHGVVEDAGQRVDADGAPRDELGPLDDELVTDVVDGALAVYTGDTDSHDGGHGTTIAPQG